MSWISPSFKVGLVALVARVDRISKTFQSRISENFAEVDGIGSTSIGVGGIAETCRTKWTR